MYAVDLVIDQAQRPALLERLFRLLQPGDPSRLIPRADPIEVAVAIDIKELGVNEVVAATFVQDHLAPIGCDEQASLATGIADDVGLSVLGEVAGNGGV